MDFFTKKHREKQMVFSVYWKSISLRGKMNSVVFFILIIFSFSSSWGNFSESEIKKAWTETGYSFEILFEDLGAEHCYKSEKRFSACLMAFHELLSTAGKGDSYQLRVSGSNLEIVSFSRPEDMTLEDIQASQAKRRESFRQFFRTGSSYPQKFRDIVQQILKFTEKIPLEDQSKAAGDTYNTYMEEAFDPNSGLAPKELGDLKFREDSVGIGAFLMFYKTKDGRTTWAVSPYKGSPAEAAGLKKGDLILSIGDFDIGGLPVNFQTEKELLDRLRGRKGTQVRLKILSVCGDEKEVEVIRGPFKGSSHWLSNYRFVNLTRQESLDCESEELSSPLPKSDDKTRAALSSSEFSSTEPQALYAALRLFKYSPNSGTGFLVRLLSPYLPFISNFPLCAEFMYLQLMDIQNSHSRGMIIDLRGNIGGDVSETACMLNTIITSDSVMLRQLPVNEGEVLGRAGKDKTTTLFFTTGGVPVDPNSPPFVYNKTIVVLVNSASASTSEVFAGTIQDMKRGWVVGRRTLGKGSVQHLVPYREIPPKKATDPPFKPLELSLTQAIHTLNSGRSPQGYGIVPDFHFSRNGESLDTEVHYISNGDRLFFNNIQFENSPWEQNRPDEVTRLNDCINKADKMGESLKKKIREDERYERPFVGDYHIELAKDILLCSDPRPDIIPMPLEPVPYIQKEGVN